MTYNTQPQRERCPRRQVTVTYVQAWVQTNFDISTTTGVHINDYGPFETYLVDTITLPDNSSYHFGYEVTVGSGISGKTTGRIMTVTLTTGGVIEYLYTSDTCVNGSNCIMADGSPTAMQRTLAGGEWQYLRVYQDGLSQPAQTTMTVIDPALNETDLNFSSIYQTSQKTCQGACTSSILDYSTICYDTRTRQLVRPARLTSPLISAVALFPTLRETVRCFPSRIIPMTLMATKLARPLMILLPAAIRSCGLIAQHITLRSARLITFVIGRARSGCGTAPAT